jgi:hypothetical protein
MFYGECYKCGERWELGTGSTCKCEAAIKWVGLTDEEIKQCVDSRGGFVEDFARAIEAKLKEKNT